MRAAITIASVLMASAGYAGEPELTVDNFYVERGVTTAIVKVVNAGPSLKMVVAKCAFLDERQTLLDVVTAIMSDVQAGSTAYAEARSRKASGVQFASCRIETALR